MSTGMMYSVLACTIPEPEPEPATNVQVVVTLNGMFRTIRPTLLSSLSSFEWVNFLNVWERCLCAYIESTSLESLEHVPQV